MQKIKTFTLALLATIAVSHADNQAIKETKPISSVDTQILQKEIDDLKVKLTALDKRQKAAEKVAQENKYIQDVKTVVEQKKTTSDYPEHFIPIPGTNSAVRFSGRLKIDGSYNAGTQSSRSAALFDIGNIALRNTTSAKKNGHVGATAQSSRFFFDTLTRTAKGDVVGFIKFDFYGPQNGGVFSTGNNGYTATLSSQNINSTDYGVRLRQAFVQFQNWKIGQDESNFADFEMAGYHYENWGMGVLPRRPQVRYTFNKEAKKGIKVSFSVEKPNTDYIDASGTSHGNESASFGKSPLPDFTTRVRYDGDMGFVSLGLIWRTLAVDARKNDAYQNATVKSDRVTVEATTVLQDATFRKNGWGLYLGGRLNQPKSPSHLFMQFFIGNGIGYLVQEGNQSAYFQFPISSNSGTDLIRYAPSFGLIKKTHILLGYQHHWTDTFKTTMAASFTYMRNPANIVVLNGSTQVNRKLSRYLVSATYNVLKTMEVAAEFAYAIRETQSGNTYTNSFGGEPGKYTPYGGAVGRGTSFVLSCIYRY